MQSEDRYWHPPISSPANVVGIIWCRHLKKIDRVWLRYRWHRQAFRPLWPFRHTISSTSLCLKFIMYTKFDNWSVLWWCSTAPHVILEAGKAQQVRHSASLVGLWTHWASSCSAI